MLAEIAVVRTLHPVARRALRGRSPNYVAFYDASSVDRIGMVKAGLPARLLTQLADDLQIPRERLFGWLGISRATANRKVKVDELLSQDESERVLGFARLIGLVEKIVTESGEPANFVAAQWTAAWLGEPNHALGGKTPGSFMDTSDGRVIVAGLVAQMQSGAYA